VLAFALLAVQIAIPWTVPHFVTGDGPSHLYTAIVAKKLLFNVQPYASLYSFNPHLVPSWASTILLALSDSIVGAGHAEQLMMSLLLCIGFFSFSYAIRGLSAKAMAFTPLSNFLLETWFLWVGFYNFYLGMALLPLGIGFYARRNGKLTMRTAIVLALWLVAMFFVHLLAAAISVMILAILAIWLHLVRPSLWRTFADSREQAHQAGFFVAAILPVIMLALIFAHSASGGIPFEPNVLKAWNEFPMHAFATASGFSGSQWYVWPAVLGLIIVSALGMRRSEWQTAKGGMVIATLAVFLAYLIVPDAGLGGNQVKVRFAWVVFLVGGLVVASSARLQPLRTPLAIFIAAGLAYNLASTARAVSAYSKATDDYLSALTAIKPGSTLIRVRFPTPNVPERYGFPGIGRDPLFHLDAYAAARLGCLDLSDYQAPTTDFPVIFNPKNALLDHDRQFALLRLENPNERETPDDLTTVRHDLPVPIDYVIVVADASSPAVAVAKASAILDSGMRLIAQSPPPPFVRVYQRTGER
jgi:hypothetical protein